MRLTRIVIAAILFLLALVAVVAHYGNIFPTEEPVYTVEPRA